MAGASCLAGPNLVPGMNKPHPDGNVRKSAMCQKRTFVSAKRGLLNLICPPRPPHCRYDPQAMRYLDLRSISAAEAANS